MYNWSHIDEKEMKRFDPVKYKKWRIVQMLNYDMQGERLDREEVKRYWPEIKEEIDPETQRAVSFLLWGTPPSLPISQPSWNKSRRMMK